MIPGTSTSTGKYVCNGCPDNATIVVEEVPGSEPVIFVDDVPVPVVPMPSKDSEVIVIVDPDTSKVIPVIVDKTDPVAPVYYDVVVTEETTTTTTTTTDEETSTVVPIDNGHDTPVDIVIPTTEDSTTKVIVPTVDPETGEFEICTNGVCETPQPMPTDHAVIVDDTRPCEEKLEDANETIAELLEQLEDCEECQATIEDQESQIEALEL